MIGASAGGWEDTTNEKRQDSGEKGETGKVVVDTGTGSRNISEKRSDRAADINHSVDSRNYHERLALACSYSEIFSYFRKLDIHFCSSN